MNSQNLRSDDESLTLYYYDDGLSEAERTALAERLEEDRALRARYEALCQALDSVGSFENYSTTTDRRARFAATIDMQAGRDAQGNTRGKKPTRNTGWLLAAGLAATLVIGIAIGLGLATSDVPVPERAVTSTTTEAPLLRRVTGHLRDSQQRLLASVDESEQDRLLLLRDIVTRNRSFVAKAEQQGDERLARLLRALEPVLLAMADEDADPEDRQALGSQLLFELNVVLTRYGNDASKEATRT